MTVSQAQGGPGSKEISNFQVHWAEYKNRVQDKEFSTENQQDGAIESCAQAEPGKKPRGHGFLGREVSLDP